jgi:hypothetical protein
MRDGISRLSRSLSSGSPKARPGGSSRATPLSGAVISVLDTARQAFNNADLIDASGRLRIFVRSKDAARLARRHKRATPIEGEMNMRKLALTLVALSLIAGIAAVADARMAASRKADRGTIISIDPMEPTWRTGPLPWVIDDPF